MAELSLEALAKELEETKRRMNEIAKKAERAQAFVDILNVLGKYTAYHSASMQEETANLFAKKTPGGKLVFNGHVYSGWEGVKNHFIGYMAALETPEKLKGMLISHDLLTPIVEVAGDGKTARSTFATIGFEGAPGMSMVCYGKYRFDFVKEDGEWKILNLDLHTHFLTPWDGPGFADYPMISFEDSCKASDADFDLAEAPDPLDDGVAKEPYLPLTKGTADSDLHHLVPPPPEPYETWDPIAEPWDLELAEDDSHVADRRGGGRKKE